MLSETPSSSTTLSQSLKTRTHSEASQRGMDIPPVNETWKPQKDYTENNRIVNQNDPEGHLIQPQPHDGAN
jgi:hypothetical protein